MKEGVPKPVDPEYQRLKRAAEALPSKIPRTPGQQASLDMWDSYIKSLNGPSIITEYDRRNAEALKPQEPRRY